MNLSAELQLAISAAKIGADKALFYYKETGKLTIHYKQDSSPYSDADIETEKAIKNAILSKDPQAKFLAEESGGNANEDTFWIIDPIDGTRSFNRGIPTWAILIALYKNGDIPLGVCYFPALETLLYAQNGKGACIDEKPAHVSTIRALQNAYIGYGSPKYFTNKQVILDLVAKSGSARSPDATYVTFLTACGKMDGMVDAYAKPWDFAPFIPIFNEAGGNITNLQGNKLTMSDTGYIASNGLLHENLVRIVRQKDD